MNRCLLLLAVPSALCALHAQIPLPPGSGTAVPSESVIEWPATIGTGPVRRVEGVFWNNTDHKSAVGVCGTALGRATAPAVTSFVTTLDVGAPVIDCVTLPTAGLQGRDALLLSVINSSSELVFACTDTGGNTVTVPVTHPGWFRALMMHAMSFGSTIHIAARSTDGFTVLRTVFNRTSGLFTQSPGLTLTEQVRDLCVIDWNNDGVTEVAVLTDTVLRVYNFAGNVVISHGLTHAGGAIEPLPELDNRSGLVLLQRNGSNNGWQLVRYFDGLADSPEPVTVATANFTLGGLTSGDINGDGYNDVVVQDGGNKVRLVKNDPEATTRFANADAIDLMTIGTAGALQKPASLCDYDFDGIVDLLVSIVSNGNAYLVLKTGLASALGRNQTFGEIFLESFHESNDPNHGPNWFKLRIDFNDYLQGFDTMKVTYYSGVENGNLGKTQFAQQVASMQYSLPLNGQPNGQYAEIHIDSNWINRPNLLFLSVQFGSLSDPRQKPTFLAGATIDHSGLTVASSPYLTLHKPPNSTERDVKRTNPANPSERKTIGVIVPQPSLPAYID